jgi:ABC-type transport system involved in cytochrome bd biosynthesis fused ATPase/permease subunit
LKLIACLLLLSGWFIALAALVMLATWPLRMAFVLAGVGVEILGLALLTRHQTEMQRRLR